MEFLKASFLLGILCAACGRTDLVVVGVTTDPNLGAANGGIADGELPVARIGDDGVCGATLCPQDQQCCLATGRCVPVKGGTGTCPLPAERSIVCGNQTCESGQICCLIDGECIKPDSRATTCPNPGSDKSTCASDADCRATEFCEPANGLCLGAGNCRSRSNCGSSTPGKYCGCDGVTRSDIQSGCFLGVVSRLGACGVQIDQPGGTIGGSGPRDSIVFCGGGSQCSHGQQCCPITGQCYDPAIPWLCSAPLAGTRIPCTADRQCSAFEFCQGPGCEGPGGCAKIGGCGGGEWNPVCGCDGITYTNAGCAASASARIVHKGVCSTTDAGEAR